MLRVFEKVCYTEAARRDFRICTGSPPASKATPGSTTQATKPMSKALRMVLCPMWSSRISDTGIQSTKKTEYGKTGNIMERSVARGDAPARPAKYAPIAPIGSNDNSHG